MKLRPHFGDLSCESRYRTSDGTAFYSSLLNFTRLCRFKDFHLRLSNSQSPSVLKRFVNRVTNNIPVLPPNPSKRPTTARLLREPHRRNKRDFNRSIVCARGIREDCPPPNIGNRHGPVRITRIELCEFLLCFEPNPFPPLPHFNSEAFAMLWNIFEDDFVQQDGNRIEVASKGVGTYAKSFKWYRASPGKWVDYERLCSRASPHRLVGGLGQRAAGGEILGHGGIIPVGKVGDEIEERAAKLHGVVEQRRVGPRRAEAFAAFDAHARQPFVRRPPEHLPAHRRHELRRALCIRRVRPERRTNDRPASRQRPPRPPDVQGGNMPMANGFLPPRMRRDAPDRQVDFDEALGGGLGHLRPRILTWNGNLTSRLEASWPHFRIGDRRTEQAEVWHLRKRDCEKSIAFVSKAFPQFHQKPSKNIPSDQTPIGLRFGAPVRILSGKLHNGDNTCLFQERAEAAPVLRELQMQAPAHDSSPHAIPVAS